MGVMCMSLLPNCLVCMFAIYDSGWRVVIEW
jgi:hypothetical protein